MMATPAASPVQKRYTAGSCTLDVVLQLSALSQWYPQPVVQDLQFKLWIQPTEQSRGVSILPRLIAKGDRTALQAISQYLSQKVQSELAIAHLSKSAPLSPDQPPFLQLAQPLSYLQLCDLTMVMRQCEQTVRALPVAIASAPAAVSTPATQAVSDTSNRRSRNVIPFAAVRRHPKLWASSAAAALLAIGLTTAVWQSGQNSASLTTAIAPTELEPSLPNSDMSPNALPKSAVEVPESIVPAQTEKLESGASLTEKQKDRPNISSNTEPAFVAPRSSEQNDTPSPVPPQVIATVPSVEPVQPSPVQPPVQREPVPSQAAADAAAPEVASETVPEVPTAPLPVQTEALRLPEAAAPGSQSEAMADNIGDRELDSALSSTDQQRISSRAAPPASPSPSSPSPSSPLPSDIYSNTDAATGEGAISSGLGLANQVIAQARPYFQRRWNDADVALEAALVYTMRVSELGDVVRFEAEGETAEGYRDRLQPEGLVIDMTQARLEAIANLTFRVEITPNGQVQITQAP